MKLITEELDTPLEIISEESLDEATGKKNLYIKGIMLQSAVKNRNGRLYPEEVMDNEVGRYIKEMVNKNRACGELNHPTSPQIDPRNISHRIVEMNKDGTNWIGKALILDTDNGRTVKGLIEGGVQLGVSSRGMGTLKMNKQGINEVQNDFRLSTASDIVFDPSGPDCWVNGIMEGVDWIYESTSDSWKAQKIEEIKEDIEASVRSRKLNEQKKLYFFEKFLKTISTRN